MPLLQFLFGKPEPEKNDPVFGRIAYQSNGWVGKYEDDTGEMLIFISGPETGPNDHQRSFMKELTKLLSKYREDAKAFIAINDPSVELSPLNVYSISISENGDIDALELSDDDADEIHHIDFVNNLPVAYGVDC